MYSCIYKYQNMRFILAYTHVNTRVIAVSKRRASEARAHHDLARVRHRNWISSINTDLGAWLSEGLSPKLFLMSNNELVSAVCRRDAYEDPVSPKRAPALCRENSNLFRCGCDGGAQLKPMDPFGYHMVGCKVGANAIRLHDEVAFMLARLFRSIRVDAIVELMRIFTEVTASGNNQRPHILLRNPRGLGRQIVIDVAVTGIEGQSRASDDLPDRPLRIRHEQKVAKYARIAECNVFNFLLLF